MIRKIILLLLIASVSNSASAVSYMGNTPCGKWVKDRSSGRVGDQLASVGWLIGYLNGVAVWSDVDILLKADGESLMLWMDNYCKANPLESVAHGGLLLGVELLKKNSPN